MRSEAVAEAIVLAIAAAMSVYALVAGSALQPGVFEPIGPGAVPMGVAVVTLLLCALVVVHRIASARRVAVGPSANDQADAMAAMGNSTPAETADELKGGTEHEPTHPTAHGSMVLGVSVSTLVYVAVLQSGVFRYGLITAVYAILTMMLMAPRRRAAWPLAVVVGVIAGFGLDGIFRYLLVADLP